MRWISVSLEALKRHALGRPDIPKALPQSRCRFLLLDQTIRWQCGDRGMLVTVGRMFSVMQQVMENTCHCCFQCKECSTGILWVVKGISWHDWFSSSLQFRIVEVGKNLRFPRFCRFPHIGFKYDDILTRLDTSYRSLCLLIFDLVIWDEQFSKPGWRCYGVSLYIIDIIAKSISISVNK